MGAFTTKTWADRSVQYAGRRALEEVSAGIVDVTRAEGTVYVEGDLVGATNLNALEGRIEDGFDYIGAVTKGTLTTGQTSITITDARITTNSILDFYTSIWGVNPLTVTPSTGQVVLTFDAQASNMIVGVGIGGY